MKTPLTLAAVALWVAGAAAIAWLGWDTAPATWMVAAAAAAGVTGLAGITLALWRRWPAGNVVALAASVALVAVAPPRLEAAGAFGFVAAAAAVLAGYYMLQLRTRAHDAGASLLMHGYVRIAATVAAAAAIAILAIFALRTGEGVASDRWAVSLDAASGQLLVVGSLAGLAVITGLSLTVLSRTYADVDAQPPRTEKANPASDGDASDADA